MSRSEFTPFQSAPQRPKGRMLVVGGVLVLVLGAFALGRVTDSNTTEPHPPAEPSAAPSETSVVESERFDETDVAWREHGGVLMPFSAAHGPSEDEDGWVRGFARTEQGAVLAGTHIFLQATRSAQLSEKAINASLTHQLTGEHAPGFVESVRDRGFEPDPGRENILVEGYSVHEYTDTGAVFELAMATQGSDESSMVTSTVITMMWQDGDWKLLVPENTMEHVRVLDNLDGFTLFPDDEP